MFSGVGLRELGSRAYVWIRVEGFTAGFECCALNNSQYSLVGCLT